MTQVPRRQRVAAYAVILREAPDGLEILLSRLAGRIVRHETWTLPGGGLDHGEDPRTALVREVHEETGLDATVGELAEVHSVHRPEADFDGVATDFHALRIVYDAWVPRDAPAPRVLEVGGSTVDARWHGLDDVLAGRVPVTAVVSDALARRRPAQVQRLAVYGLALRGSGAQQEVLLVRLSERSPHPGTWALPGGGLAQGEPPAAALEREFAEETGLTARVGAVLGVHDTHFTGTAPSGRVEDFHGIHLVHAVEPGPGEPAVAERGGSTAAAAWVPVADVLDGRVEALDVVRWALGRR